MQPRLKKIWALTTVKLPYSNTAKKKRAWLHWLPWKNEIPSAIPPPTLHTRKVVFFSSGAVIVGVSTYFQRRFAPPFAAWAFSPPLPFSSSSSSIFLAKEERQDFVPPLLLPSPPPSPLPLSLPPSWLSSVHVSEAEDEEEGLHRKKTVKIFKKKKLSCLPDNWKVCLLSSALNQPPPPPPKKSFFFVCVKTSWETVKKNLLFCDANEV